MAKVLVVGGAGYVGGTACAWLLDHGHDVWILDDLSRGHRRWVERLRGGPGGERLRGFTHARAGDSAVVEPLLARERFDCVMHFAAFALVAESVAQPELYQENNVDQTRALLESMLRAGTRRFIFSSTCAIFGDPGASVPRISEDTPKNPVNPYGATKLEVEGVLRELAENRGLQAIALRYFNAAGAEAGGRVGEWHEDETHLIPRMFHAVMRGEPLQMFGTDYPTADGTAVRDYVHVSDLAQAHEAAMLRLLGVASEAQGRFETYNLGSERGYSVREMVAACERAIGRKVPVVERPRRPGDPPHLIADATRARSVLGFRTPAQGALERIFETAWRWEQQLADLSRNSGKAVFLDRDGTINFDPGYLSKPDQMQLIPGVGAALKRLKDAGFGLAVVSNQSGVGRGIIQRGDLPLIHARMDELLGEHGVRIDHYELCTHRPEEDCACRKPKAKLLLDSARALGANPARSYMVGDKLSDLQAGVNAGCRGSVLVRTGEGKDAELAGTGGAAAFTANSLVEAVEWILAQGT